MSEDLLRVKPPRRSIVDSQLPSVRLGLIGVGNVGVVSYQLILRFGAGIMQYQVPSPLGFIARDEVSMRPWPPYLCLGGHFVAQRNESQ
jgi:hypothetical protein